MRTTLVVLVIVVIALAVIISACVVIVSTFVENVPPDALTRTRMTVIEKRISDYATAHDRLPENLAELPKLTDNRDDSLVDGWGRPIQYEKKGQTVTLQSLGKDGRPGGNGEDADIRVTFSVSGH